jgi:hypothetical protein
MKVPVKINTGPLPPARAAVVMEVLQKLIRDNPNVTGYWLHASSVALNPILSPVDIDIHFLGDPDIGPAGEPFRQHKIVVNGITLDLWPHIWGDIYKPEELRPATLVNFARSHILWERDNAVTIPHKIVRKLLQDQKWIETKLRSAIKGFSFIAKKWDNEAAFLDSARGPWKFAWDLFFSIGGLVAAVNLMSPTMGRRTIPDIYIACREYDLPEVAESLCFTVGLYDFTIEEARDWERMINEAWAHVFTMSGEKNRDQMDYYFDGARELLAMNESAGAMWPLWRVANSCARKIAGDENFGNNICQKCLIDLHQRVGMGTFPQFRTKLALIERPIALLGNSVKKIACHLTELAKQNDLHSNS